MLALRCMNGVGGGSFVVAYTPSGGGDTRVELWNWVGERGERSASLGTLPAGTRPLLTSRRIGSVGGRSVSSFGADGIESRKVALPKDLVGIADGGDAKGGALLVAAFTSGELVAYDRDGNVRWRRVLPTRGRLIDFEGSGDHAAWASDEAGGRVGIVDLTSGDSVNVAMALAKGTLTVRNPLRRWFRRGSATLLAP